MKGVVPSTTLSGGVIPGSVLPVFGAASMLCPSSGAPSAQRLPHMVHQTILHVCMGRMDTASPLHSSRASRGSKQTLPYSGVYGRREPSAQQQSMLGCQQTGGHLCSGVHGDEAGVVALQQLHLTVVEEGAGNLRAHNHVPRIGKLLRCCNLQVGMVVCWAADARPLHPTRLLNAGNALSAAPCLSWELSAAA